MPELNTAQKIAQPIVEGMGALAFSMFGGTVMGGFAHIKFNKLVGHVVGAGAGGINHMLGKTMGYMVNTPRPLDSLVTINNTEVIINVNESEENSEISSASIPTSSQICTEITKNAAKAVVVVSVSFATGYGLYEVATYFGHLTGNVLGDALVDAAAGVTAAVVTDKLAKPISNGMKSCYASMFKAKSDGNEDQTLLGQSQKHSRVLCC